MKLKTAPARRSTRRLLTIDEVADRLAISVGAIRSWRLRGEGPPALLIGSRLRYEDSALEDWISAQTDD